MFSGVLPTCLPDEVLLHILHYCDYRTITRFSTTCKSSYQIVHQSTSLQLQIELEIGGLEIADRSLKDGGDCSSILRELQKHRDAWLELRLSLAAQIPTLHQAIRHPRWYLQSGIYMMGFRESEKEYQGDRRNDRIQLIDLHSHGILPILDCKKKFDDYAVDVNQDLVVLFENIKESSNSGSIYARVHMCHAVTGLPHPFARLPTLFLQFDDSWEPAETNIIILGHILVIKLAGPMNVPHHCCASIWDWKSGLLFGDIHIEAESNDAAIAFLDKTHLFVCPILPNSTAGHQRSNQAGLLFYRIPTFVTTNNQEPPCADFHVPSSSHGLEPVLVLEFPKLHSAYELGGCTLESQPFLGDLAYRGPAKVVYSHTTTIPLYLWVKRRGRPRTDVGYYIFIDTGRIFEHLVENRTQEEVRMPWSRWGVSTRWFTDTDMSGAHFGDTYGSRHSIWDFSAYSTDQLLAILEFNPRIIGRHMCSSSKSEKTTVSEGQRLFKHSFDTNSLKNSLASLDLGEEIVTEVVGRDIKTIIETGFEEPVESSLPYMLAVKQHIPKHRTWYLQADCLIGGSVSGNLGQNDALTVFYL